MTVYATQARSVFLPPPSPTPRQVYSVPRLGGGYDYYEGPDGIPPLNDDYPVPNIAHPNDIGISSLAVGRALPLGSVHVGSGLDAIGSVTPTPGAAMPLSMSGYGLDVPLESSGALAGGLLALVFGGLAWFVTKKIGWAAGAAGIGFLAGYEYDKNANWLSMRGM